MVGVSGASSANQTGLRCHEFEVAFIAMAAGLADGEFTFFDFCGSCVDLNRCRSRRVIINGRGDRRRGGLLGLGFDLSGASPWSPRWGGVRWHSGRLGPTWIGWDGTRFIRRQNL